VIAVVTRVSSASVEVDGAHEAIGVGVLVLLAVEPGDSEHTVRWMAKKLSHLRVFPDEQGRMNRSVLDTHGSILLISQFTLAGDCMKGHRPSFIGAAPPEMAEPTYEALAEGLRSEYGLTVRTGVFGAAMRVSSVNEGPVTLIIRTPK
jgi:D-tyrosyl-tRNA(Tyr) deacylase